MRLGSGGRKRKLTETCRVPRKGKWDDFTPWPPLSTLYFPMADTFSLQPCLEISSLSVSLLGRNRMELGGWDQIHREVTQTSPTGRGKQAIIK